MNAKFTAAHAKIYAQSAIDALLWLGKSLPAESTFHFQVNRALADLVAIKNAPDDELGR